MSAKKQSHDKPQKITDSHNRKSSKSKPFISTSLGTKAFEEADIRKQFPLLQAYPELSYLDNAASTQKPMVVLEALDRYYREDNANVHRSLYSLAERATQAFENARDFVGQYLGAASSREIVFTRGSTESLNLLAWSLSELLLSPGDVILLTPLEHHANLVPWQQAAARKGARLVFLPITAEATLDLAYLDELESSGLAERVKIMSVGHVSNAFGTLHPLKAISAWCQKKAIPLILDAAQSLPHLPIDVKHLGVDFLVFSGHKVYGPMGVGVLWGREKWLERLDPWQTGGEMIASVSLEKSTWNTLPYKFEAGTPNVGGAVGLAAALRWLEQWGWEFIEKKERELESYAYYKLKDITGLKLYGPADPSHRRAVFSFNVEGLHSHDVAQYLDKQGLAIRSGHHCNQPGMRLMGIPSTARASLGIYNTKADIDCLTKAIIGAQEYFH